MNRVPVLSTASEIGLVSGEPEYTSLAAPVRSPPTAVISMIRPTPVPLTVGVSPIKRSPWASRASAWGIDNVKPVGVNAKANPFNHPTDLIVARIRDEDRALVRVVNCDGLWTLLNPPVQNLLCVDNDRGRCCAHALEPQRTSARMGAQKNFHFDAEYFGGNGDCISDMATGLLYNFGSVIPSLRGGC